MQLEEGARAIALHLQCLERRMFAGRVAQQSDETRRARVADPAHRQAHRKHAAVLAPGAHFAADADDLAHAGLEVARQVTVVRAALRFGHEHADVVAQQLVNAIAEDAGGGVVHGQYPAAVIDDHDGIHRRLHERLGIPWKTLTAVWRRACGLDVRNTTD